MHARVTAAAAAAASRSRSCRTTTQPRTHAHAHADEDHQGAHMAVPYPEHPDNARVHGRPRVAAGGLHGARAGRARAAVCCGACRGMPSGGRVARSAALLPGAAARTLPSACMAARASVGAWGRCLSMLMMKPSPTHAGLRTCSRHIDSTAAARLAASLTTCCDRAWPTPTPRLVSVRHACMRVFWLAHAAAGGGGGAANCMLQRHAQVGTHAATHSSRSSPLSTHT
jgi:hypothetical protein